MNLLPFMHQKALEKGIKICSNCKKEDIFYGLGEMCLECNEPLPENDKAKSLQYSIELFTEFFEKYDEIYNWEAKKDFIQFLKASIHHLISKGGLENERIIKLQAIINNIDTIGSNTIGGAISVKNLKPGLQLLESYNSGTDDPLIRIKSFSGVILAIQYIFKVDVLNEYIIETSIPKTISSKPKPSSQAGSNSKGCLGSLILLISILILTTIALIKLR